MKLSINKNTLESAISLCSAYADKKDISSISSHLLFEASDDKLVIKASDFEIGLIYKIKKIKIEKEGFATVQAKSIVDMIKNLSNEEIILETVENSLFIRQKSTKYKLAMFNYEDFPLFPNTEGKDKFDLDSSDLSRSLKKILPVVDTNNPKPSLNGALIDIKGDRINFVSTDTKRLAIYTLNKNSEKEFSLSIPKKAIMEMQKLFYEKIELFYGDNILIAKNENFEFYTKLINDKFPDYEKVIPTSNDKAMEVDCKLFSEAVDRVSSVAYEKSKAIKLKLSKSKLTLLASTPDSGSAFEDLEVVYDSDSMEIGFNSKYLLDIASQIEGKFMKFMISDGSSPAIITELDDESAIYVLMPMRI